MASCFWRLTFTVAKLIILSSIASFYLCYKLIHLRAAIEHYVNIVSQLWLCPETLIKKCTETHFLGWRVMNRLDSGRQRKLRHRKVKFFYVTQQLKGRAMNRIKVSRFVISVQLAKWDSLSYNYTFYVCSSRGQQYVEIACLGQRSSADACENTGNISESCINNKMVRMGSAGGVT